MIRRCCTVLLAILLLSGLAAAQEMPAGPAKPPEIKVSTPPPLVEPGAPPTAAPALAPTASPLTVPSGEVAPAPIVAGPTAPGGSRGSEALPPGQQQEAPPWYMQMWPFLLIIVIFYFLLIRPQQKKAKEHQNMLKAINKGDQVMTTGGVFGRVTGMTDQIVTLEISDRVRIKVARSYIAGKAAPDQGKVPEPPQR